MYLLMFCITFITYLKKGYFSSHSTATIDFPFWLREFQMLLVLARKRGKGSLGFTQSFRSGSTA